jgi:hypothetical protein
VALAVLPVLLLLGVACSDDGSDGGEAPALDDPVATATELVLEYFRLVQEQDAQGLADFLSDAFIIQRADGTTLQKAAYVQSIPELRRWEISEVQALQAGNLLVVRWLLAVDVTIEGQAYRGDPAPRLSTFAYEDGAWRLASYANFNVPATD